MCSLSVEAIIGQVVVWLLLLLLSLVGWDWVHYWPILPALDNRWLWSNWWNEDWQGKPKYTEKTCPSATLFTINPTGPDPGPNLARRGGKPASNTLSYGAAIVAGLMVRLCVCVSRDAKWIGDRKRKVTPLPINSTTAKCQEFRPSQKRIIWDIR
jgi:hypothetical protein